MVHRSFHLTPGRTMHCRDQPVERGCVGARARRKMQFVKCPLRLVRNFCGAISSLAQSLVPAQNSTGM